VEDLALFFHLLGALLFVAGIILAGAAFEVARRRERPSEIALLLGLTRIGAVLVGVGALLLLAFGVWLVHLEHLSYRAGWISTSIALYVVALGLGAAGGQSKHATSRPSWLPRTLRQASGSAGC
jgi:cytochrome bd-type quinol oxidase subunit 2